MVLFLFTSIPVCYRYYIATTFGKTSDQFCNGMDKIIEQGLVRSTDRKHFNDTTNMLGHIIKITAYFFLYRAIIETSLREPYNQLLKEITRREQIHTIFTASFENSPSAIFFIDLPDMIIIDVNPTLEKLTGYSRIEIIGKSLRELQIFDIESILPYFDEKYASDVDVRRKLIYRTKNMHDRMAVASITKINVNGLEYFLGAMIDVTKQVQLEAKIAQLDRLNLVGEMAASIGHEVRNPMTTVRGYLQLFQRRTEFVKYDEQLRIMIEEIDRANNIITEFLSLAKNKRISLQRGNLNDAVNSLFLLIQADAFRMGHNVTIETGDIPETEFDPQEIRQLLLNLTRNSMEAMKTSGLIAIRTYYRDNAIMLEVQDTGPGMPNHILKQLGTPFVTTKDNGTGLGLPVCYRIAERHNAELKIQSSSEGTTICVVFRKNTSR